MYSHSIFVAENTPVREMTYLAWRVEKLRDRQMDERKKSILMRRPRQRSPEKVQH